MKCCWVHYLGYPKKSQESWPPFKTSGRVIAAQMVPSGCSVLHNASQQLFVHDRDWGCPSKFSRAVLAAPLLAWSNVSPERSFIGSDRLLQLFMALPRPWFGRQSVHSKQVYWSSTVTEEQCSAPYFRLISRYEKQAKVVEYLIEKHTGMLWIETEKADTAHKILGKKIFHKKL